MLRVELKNIALLYSGVLWLTVLCSGVLFVPEDERSEACSISMCLKYLQFNYNSIVLFLANGVNNLYNSSF